MSRHRRQRVAIAEGFSLHADTAVHGNDREGLERLYRYGSGGPIAECRLLIRPAIGPPNAPGLSWLRTRS